MGNKVRTLSARTAKLAPLINNVRARDTNKRMRGYPLIRRNGEMMRRQPFCVECLKRGIETVAVETDHITPLDQNGSDEIFNLQRLCKECHDAKTAAENGQRHNYNVW